MFTREQILLYRCPRWSDWPNLDLYMDQAVSLIGQSVQLFYTDGQPNPVTSTMINNYVKQKLVPPSRKKKYGRDHLVYFYVIFLLKSTLNLVDISDAIAFFCHREANMETFHLFCDEIESALAMAFGGEPRSSQTKASDEINIIRSLALAFAYMLHARYQIAADRG